MNVEDLENSIVVISQELDDIITVMEEAESDSPSAKPLLAAITAMYDTLTEKIEPLVADFVDEERGNK